MKYVYPAIFTPLDNGSYDVYAPNLPGCRTFGQTLAESIEMAEDAIAMWLADAETNNEDIPAASADLEAQAPAFINLIAVDTDAWHRINDTKAVKKTLSIPSWLNHAAEKANAPFSQILQQGLKQYLGLDK